MRRNEPRVVASEEARKAAENLRRLNALTDRLNAALARHAEPRPRDG